VTIVAGVVDVAAKAVMPDVTVIVQLSRKNKMWLRQM
jgi:hypothetical protein